MIGKDDESGGNNEKIPAAESPRKINVALNCLEVLKQKAPTD